jgi:hypothetical protein
LAGVPAHLGQTRPPIVNIFKGIYHEILRHRRITSGPH